MGERDEDLIDLALALREFKPDSIPINTFHRRPARRWTLRPLTPQRCLKALCLFRSCIHGRRFASPVGGNITSAAAAAGALSGGFRFVNGLSHHPGQPGRKYGA